MNSPTRSKTIGDTLRKSSESRSRKLVWGFLLGIGALLVLVGTWTNDAVEKTMHDHLTEALQTILQANIEALQIVVANERAHIQAWAKDTEIRIFTQQILNNKRPAEARRKLDEVLVNVLAEEGYIGYAIIDPAGVIRATDQPDPYLGKTLSPAAMAMLGSVLAGGVSFGKPFAKDSMLADPVDVSGRPVQLARAPIPDIEGNNNIATLVFTIDPEKDFTRILSVAEFGRSGTTYAFNDQGVMLSESRHEQQLKELGLIPNTPESTAILTLQLRDPGVDLTKGKTVDQPISDWPLTRMAETAVTGLPGLNIEGYRDYRGVKVIGAWQWLDEYGFGVATEVERSEALSSLRPVRLAFVGLFALLVVTAGGFLATGFFLKRLQNEITELRELGQYTLVEKIGEGGMGKVYKAKHAMLRRPTAIKLIREDQLNEKTVERFEQEVQLTSQLTHPNTISVYDYGHSPDGVFYYAMEYLSGINIGQLVRIEPQLPIERVVHILRQTCGSLAEAHGHGLIHRDIKPGNIMLCQRGGEHDVVKVLDFGLVREIAPRNKKDLSQHEIMGTPGFIAPELLVVNRQVDARSDLYAVGAIGFLMLTGQPVFGEQNNESMLHDIVYTDPPRPSARTDRKIPEALDDLVYACLSRDPDERPATATELAARLADIPLENSWTQQAAADWWQEKESRIALERNLGRSQESDVFETVMDIDFGERA